MKEDNILTGQINDKITQCRDNYMVTMTAFLDSHQQSVARSLCRGADVKTFFYGGYEDAERTILMCLPDYADPKDQEPLCVIRASGTPGGRALTHRDYLGSLVGLGIKRDPLGDILVRPDGADIIVLSEMADFILTNYGKAGRTILTLSRHHIAELIVPDQQVTTVTDTVASMRLDNIVSSCFKLSRSKAVEAIKKGLVFVNHIEAEHIDAKVAEGDKIVLRGNGKAILTEVGGRSRKDRQYIRFERYK